MIRATHVIVSAYGFWLPNDPRGSWSDFVRSWEVLRHGPATKVQTRRSVAETPHDVQQRQAAKKALRHPAVCFNGVQARAIARGFAQACAEGGYVVHACAVMPDHAHLVVARHPRPIMQIIAHLKGRATRQLREEGIDPMQGQASPWAHGAWKVFLDREDDGRRSIRYVEDNPVRTGLRRQHWNFVVPWTG